ncbi:hypothetical protein [Burkholderia sp. Bp9142]|uniref:hypothetical protein n=1 Tax=Burkholderia sp. Bp9142 TaxID=2184573 RepID=UPI000F59F738|nr:hypothetical protein [Burkholderia sp. Bp9142]RQR27313.1 hypothetical protein DIE22_31055 [Burkholderia sp. Bp9142]
MKRNALWVLAGCFAAAMFLVEQIPAQSLSADQIVEKNVAARGGLDAWRKVQTMVWIGHVDSANAVAPNLPFVLAMKRPNKTRFEVTVLNQRAVRVFDGRDGWKLRPGATGRTDLRPYTPDELNFARDEQVIDGMLIDHEAKGIGVTLDGVEQVGGREAYRLAVKLPSGLSRHVWIDARTFLEVKYDRVVRDLRGQPVSVEVAYLDYRNVDGLQMPFTIESGGAASARKDRLTIDKIALNPPLGDAIFAKPAAPGRRGSVSVDVDATPAMRGKPMP